jgi:predicted nucleic acid-binding protein
MTTAIDSNVFVALWDKDDSLNSLAQAAMDAALSRGALVVSAPVFAELIAAPRRDEDFVDAFFKETGIFVDWNLEESVWRTAGRAFQSYSGRRRTSRDSWPRRILADFLIGAHALHHSFALLSLDTRLYRAAFPRLRVIAL